MQASVVIPVWNGASDIEACLTALFEYSGDQLGQVICVDNASDDDSVERIRRFPEVTLLQQATNLGFAGGVNVGLDAAAGDPLILLNQDCIVRPGWLTALSAAFDSHPEIGVAGVTVLNDDGSVNHAGAEIVKPAGFGLHHTEIRNSTPYPVDYVTGAAFALRRTVWETVGRFDEGYYPAYFEEADYCYRARHNGFEVSYVPQSRVTHLFTSLESLRHPFRRAASQHRMRYRFVCKHFTADELRAFATAELKSLTTGDYLNEVMGRAIAARSTLEGLNDILERRRSDLDDELSRDLQPLLRQAFSRIARQALAASSHLSRPRFESWDVIRDRIDALKKREYDLLRRIYFRAPDETEKESRLRRLARLLVLRPLSFLIGRDYLLLSELNTVHVARLDAGQALSLAQNDLVEHLLGLLDLYTDYENL